LAQLSIVNNFFIILFALFITFCSANLGFLVLRLFKFTKINDEETRIFTSFYSICLGFILIIFFIYIFAIFGGINKFSIWGLLIFQIILFIFSKDFFLYIKELFFIFVSKLKVLFKKNNSWFIVFTLILLIYFFIAGLLISSTPTMEVDSSTTYLNAAKLFLKYNTIVNVGNIVGNDTKNGYLIMTYGIALNSGILAQLLLFILSFSGILFFYIFLIKRANIFISSIIILIFIIMRHQVDIVIKTAKIDGLSFTFSAFVLITFINILINKNLDRVKKGYLYLIGIATGFLLGLRYFNICFIILMFIFFLLFFNKGSYKIKFIKSLIWFLLVIFVASPGYLFNIYNFKNPVYPFFEKIFNSSYGTTLTNESWIGSSINIFFKELSVKGDIQKIISLPMSLLTDPVKLNSAPEKVFSIFWIIILLIIPITILLALFLKRAIFKTDTFKFFMIAFIGYLFLYIMWSNSGFVLRYFIVGFPYLFLLSAMTLKILIELIGDKILNKLKIIFPILLLCFCIIVYVNLHPINNLFRKNASKIFHNQTVDEIISSEFTYKEDNGNITNFGKGIIELKGMVKNGDKVLSFIPAVYYMGDNAIVFTGYGATLPSKLGMKEPLYKYNSSTEFINSLKESGFTYIILNPNYLCTVNENEKKIIFEFIEKVRPLKTVENIFIYKI
jgi:hypothetical protein